jgi:hypothetical protein
MGQDFHCDLLVPMLISSVATSYVPALSQLRQ